VNPSSRLRIIEELARRTGTAIATGTEATLSGEPAGRDVLTTSQLSPVWFYIAGIVIAIGGLFASAAIFGLGLLLGAAILASWFWSRVCLRNLTVERRFGQTRAFWGEEIEMSQVFTNNKPLPIPWLAIEDFYPGKLELTSSLKEAAITSQERRINTAMSIGWYERVTRRYRILCKARGEHNFGPITVNSGDVFGLFRRYETVKTPQTLIVYPRYVPIEQLGIPARQPFGDFKAVQHLATDPLRLRTIREYALGDNPRHIHWKATARRGALQTKLFEPAATPQLLVFCNQDTFTHMWEGIDRETLELTITVAASIANHALEEGYMVGLQVNAFGNMSDTQVKVPPSRNPDQFTRILENLARIEGWSGLPMEELIRAERRALPIGATLVIVTGVVTADMLDILLALRRAGHPITLICTTASRRAAHKARDLSPQRLQSQGITYYLVEAIGQAQKVESLAF
jgi:uncharacterized protein (DUF58 family)